MHCHCYSNSRCFHRQCSNHLQKGYHSIVPNYNTNTTKRVIVDILLWLYLKLQCNTICCRLSWWRHQKETFFALHARCAGNSPVTGEFPSQRPVTRSFDVFFNCARINCWVNSREADDLRHHRPLYDVTVMFNCQYYVLLVYFDGGSLQDRGKSCALIQY